ncbi:MFS transporter [Larsenimonas suaedae]|uniref:MFS transporter n=1 Tax=Larsenimonas suaedae TaxID=1851019 RepID=A0ABU1GS43_9GAMM|nr:MFS transporter [Larsenimonas suaedae]MCM2972400.1 MFS transporter [Larsenimonas suaedae]MDR5894804.1 MFS transporter [Larsenimonas suaedae]
MSALLRSRRFWLIAFMLAALLLRAPIVVLGPVLAPIMSTLSLSSSEASLLTTLVILCFGLLSPIAPTLAGRLGLDRALAIAMAAVALGGVLRGVAHYDIMLIGTLLVGFGIACANVFMPSVVKRDRPDRLGQTMGLYTMVMGVGATLASGLAVSTMELAGSWSAPIWLWAVIAVVPAMLWGIRSTHAGKRPSTTEATTIRAMMGSRVAWMLTLFLGVQSFSFYTFQTWLPTLATEGGVSHDMAGWMLATANLISMPVSYLVARIAARCERHSALAFTLTSIIGVALVGLMWSPSTLPLFWALCLGAGQGGCFTLALTLIVLRSQSSADASALSGMSQSIGYLMAASGPLVFGAFKEATGDWQASLVMMMILLGFQVVFGVLIGRPTKIQLRSRVR